MKTMLKNLTLFAALLACGYALAMPPLYQCSPYQSICPKPPVCQPQTALARWLAAVAPWYAITIEPNQCPRY